MAAPGLIREGRGYGDELNRQTVSDFGKPGAIPVCERSTGDVLDEVEAPANHLLPGIAT